MAKISINRPRVRNAFRPITVRELKVAVAAAQDDTDVVRVVMLCMYVDALCGGMLLTHRSIVQRF